MTVELLNIDCMEYMKAQPDNAFDLAIVDPPYGIGISSNMGRRSRDTKSNYKKIDWDNETPSPDYFVELLRVSKNQIVWGGNYFTDNLTQSRCWLLWDKKSYDCDFSSHELAWTSFDKVVKCFIRARNTENEHRNKIHPTQKPVKLYQWLLENYAKPGQRILDTHLGSGSSAIAAHYGGFDFVGCELDEDYFIAAQKRFERETAQISMF